MAQHYSVRRRQDDCRSASARLEIQGWRAFVVGIRGQPGLGRRTGGATPPSGPGPELGDRRGFGAFAGRLGERPGLVDAQHQRVGISGNSLTHAASGAAPVSAQYIAGWFVGARALRVERLRPVGDEPEPGLDRYLRPIADGKCRRRLVDPPAKWQRRGRAHALNRARRRRINRRPKAHGRRGGAVRDPMDGHIGPHASRPSRKVRYSRNQAVEKKRAANRAIYLRATCTDARRAWAAGQSFEIR